MNRWLHTLLELLPLQVLALAWHFETPATSGIVAWPYAASALCALLCTTFLLWRKALLDRILLGVNIAIALCALGLYGGTPGLPGMLADLRGAGFFAFILLTAGVTYLMRPAALLDIPRGQAEPWDRYMLLATFVAFLLALLTRTQPMFTAMLLVALFVTRTSLQRMAQA